jgi:predicted peroxiredoxin
MSPPEVYGRRMEILYLATSGSSDPTRASIPIHLAVNGSLEVGQSVTIVLGGDATELLTAATRDTLEGVGVPPARELFAKAREHEVPVFV